MPTERQTCASVANSVADRRLKLFRSKFSFISNENNMPMVAFAGKIKHFAVTCMNANCPRKHNLQKLAKLAISLGIKIIHKTSGSMVL